MPFITSRRVFLKRLLFSTSSFFLSPLQKAQTLGRVTTRLVYVYQAPDFNSQQLYMRYRDDLVHLYYPVDTGEGRNPLWYRVWKGYIHSAFLQRVETRLNPTLVKVVEPGVLGEVTVPYTRAYQFRRESGWSPINRLYYGSVHWVNAIEEGPNGEAWYRIQDSYERIYYAFSGHLRPILPEELAPLFTEVPPDQKHIDVSITEQTLSAYQAGRLILKTRISSGVPQLTPPPPDELPTDTPLGNFHITVKTPCRHMGDKKLNDDPDSTALLGVPWVSFFHETGLSLHGTYWHSNFGVRMSHGCVNLQNEDAKWLYRWTVPIVGADEKEISAWGTRVTIHE